MCLKTHTHRRDTSQAKWLSVKLPGAATGDDDGSLRFESFGLARFFVMLSKHV